MTATADATDTFGIVFPIVQDDPALLARYPEADGGAPPCGAPARWVEPEGSRDVVEVTCTRASHGYGPHVAHGDVGVLCLWPSAGRLVNPGLDGQSILPHPAYRPAPAPAAFVARSVPSAFDPAPDDVILRIPARLRGSVLDAIQGFIERTYEDDDYFDRGIISPEHHEMSILYRAISDAPEAGAP